MHAYILGFDPGGQGNFGWSICDEVDGILQIPATTGLANDALDAIRCVKKEITIFADSGNPPVLAAGIDAPLFWSTRGNREIDNVLDEDMRATGFPPPKRGGRIVQAVNSLMGGCGVQGILLAKFLNETPWDIKITESHPKVLDHLLKHSGQPSIVSMTQHLTANLTSSHESDATLCAVAAWAMIHCQNSPKWRNLYEWESDHVQPFGTPVSYWMPIPQYPNGS